MPYRADIDALEARATVLERELAAVRERAKEAASLKEAEADLERDLAETRRRLAASASSRVASRLDDVKIATPCHARWEDMIGDDRVRFCGKCQNDVFNLSAMAREEAETLLRERSGSMCARLYRRPDGTVLTADCPVGVRAKRVRRLAFVAVGSGMAAGAMTTFAASVRMGDIAPPQRQAVSQGAVELPPEPRVADAPDDSSTAQAIMGAPMLPPPPPMMGKVQQHRPITHK